MTVRKTREMQEILKSFEVIGIYWERERQREKEREILAMKGNVNVEIKMSIFG